MGHHRWALGPLTLAAWLLLMGAPSPGADLEALEHAFAGPPDDARIMMRWWWFGPAVTTQELEREMRLMKEGGIGGFEVQPVYPLALDDPRTGIRNLRFLSPEFLDALRFTGEKAKELGLRFDLTLGSGWPYGGPWFPIGEAAGRLRFQAVRVGAGQQTVPLPPLREGETLIAAFGRGPASDGPMGWHELEVREHEARLPARRDAEDQEPITVLFCIAGHTGMKVKRAAVGAEGYVIDHYNPRVIAKFLEMVAEPEVRACGSNPPHAVFCDSLEVAGEDWTGDFLDEFRRRRGYDLRPHLPEIYGGEDHRAKDVRHDWGRTLTELFNDRFMKVVAEWAKDHSTRLRIQAYGTPPAALSSYAFADLDEAEGYLWKEFEETRWASSASHLLGRPVTSSETWTWLHSPVFRASPLDMKAEADLHFLQGVNQLIGHGWPYTPPGIEPPGWRFYAAGVFNEQNPWWIVMPDVAKYLQRVSFLLRQGDPSNDVALYLSNSDAWAHFTPGKVSLNAAVGERLGRELIRQVLEAGYNLDFFDDQLLALRGKVLGAPAGAGNGPGKDGAGDNAGGSGSLAFGKLRYRVVILSGVERMPLQTLRLLERFALSGGILIATRRLPERAPGLLAGAQEHQEVQSLARRLFEGPDAPGLFLESETALGSALRRRLRPDVEFSPQAADIGFVHRHLEQGELYFLANTSPQRQRVKASFRVAGMEPDRWEPLSGRVERAGGVERSTETTTIPLELEPYGSQVVVFSHRPPTPEVAAPRAAVDAPQPLDLSHDWSVSFGEGQAPAVWEDLRSWTDAEATRHFSGVATYRKRLVVPEAMLDPRLRLALDFGEARPVAGPMGRMHAMLEAPVREAAIVYVNDRRAGSVWCPPYRLDVTGLLRRGDNQIRIEVANLALNQMSAHPLPDYAELKARYGDRFQPQDMGQVAPVTAGLLGPIRLLAGPGR